MRDLRELDKYRFMEGDMQRFKGYGGEKAGTFVIPGTPPIRIIADVSPFWDHVSVSTPDRTPTWEEMELVKRLFFKDTEVAYQLHVPPTDHINIHPHCLHLWRHRIKRVPLPPKDRV